MKKDDLEIIKSEKKKGYKFSIGEGKGKNKNAEVVAVDSYENGALGICYVMEVGIDG